MLPDPDCAVAVARYLVVYLHRRGSDPQLSPWLEGRNHIHPAVHRVQDAIAADLTKAWNLNALARISGAIFPASFTNTSAWAFPNTVTVYA